MTMTTAGVIFIVTLVAALVAVYKPFGDYMFRAVAGTKQSRVERGIFRLIGVNPAAEQTWGVYARSVLAFSAVSLLFLYLFQRVQNHFVAVPGLRPGGAARCVEHCRVVRDQHQLAVVLG